ncbi:MAG: hypothetical protein M3Q58_16290 [Bacteroidota bacterium]|nr:hypothetical protein [Bacteroidota bacterium]
MKNIKFPICVFSINLFVRERMKKNGTFQILNFKFVIIIFCLFIISCSKNKITNITEARHFLATHSWHTDNAQFYGLDGKPQAKLSSGVEFSETEITFNKEKSPYNIVKMSGGEGNNFHSQNPYFIITAWDNYSSSDVKFYLMEDGMGWLENSRVKMTFMKNKDADVQKMDEQAGNPEIDKSKNSVSMVNKVLTVSVSTAMVYKKPSMKTDYITSYKKRGEEIVSVAEDGNFVSVAFLKSNKIIGWVLKSDLKIVRDIVSQDTIKESSGSNHEKAISETSKGNEGQFILTYAYCNVEGCTFNFIDSKGNELYASKIPEKIIEFSEPDGEDSGRGVLEKYLDKKYLINYEIKKILNNRDYKEEMVIFEMKIVK